MWVHHRSQRLALTALFLLGLRPLVATPIGTGETVNDFSLTGQNADFDSTLTRVSTGTNPNYDTGAGFIRLTGDVGDFRDSLGIGPNQVQWTGSGGFSTDNPNAVHPNVNIGGLATPSTLTWGVGGFVPDGSALVLNGATFLNNINLGTDPNATRQIDIGISQIKGSISGSGNLLFQGYGQASFHGLIGPPSIDISGQVTLNNIRVLLGATTAASFDLTNNAILESEVLGSPNMLMSSGSIWSIAQLDGTNFLSQSVGNLTSTDGSTLIGLGGQIGGQNTSAALTIHSGYFAGQVLDGLDAPIAGQGGSLIKDGPGILTLANDNSGAGTPGAFGYSQGTTVKQGTLLVTNTTGSATSTGAVTVMSGGALGGTGIIAPTGANNIVVQSGGKIDLTAFDPAHAPASFTNNLIDGMTLTGQELNYLGVGAGMAARGWPIWLADLATDQWFKDNHHTSPPAGVYASMEAGWFWYIFDSDGGEFEFPPGACMDSMPTAFSEQLNAPVNGYSAGSVKEFSF